MALLARAVVDRSCLGLLRSATCAVAWPRRRSTQAVVRQFNSSAPLYKKRRIARPSNSPTGKREPAPVKPAPVKPAPVKPEPAPQPDWTLRYSSEDAKLALSLPEKDDSPTQGAVTRKWWSKAPADLYDTTQLKAHFNHIDTYWRAEIQSALTGGHFNADALGNLMVRSRDILPPFSPPTPLRELAHVVPRGRSALMILVHDATDIQRVQKAVLDSNFNQKPRQSEENACELTIKLEFERREMRVRRIRDLYQLWYKDIRLARFKQERLIKTMRLDGELLPDQYRKARAAHMKAQGQRIQAIIDEENAWRQTQKKIDGAS